MEEVYGKLVELMRCILEPFPANQLGVPDHCRYVLSVLAGVKHKIEELEEYYCNMMRQYDITMDEEL